MTTHIPITFIVATSNRPTLEATLRSIELWPEDELLVVGEGVRRGDPRARYLDCPAGNNWGHAERNFAMPHARGRYLAHLDDDDAYVVNHRVIMEGALRQRPGLPVIFRMRYAGGQELWRDRIVRCGNVGTPMSLLPNDPARLGRFGPDYGGDIEYLEAFAGNSGYASGDFVWSEEAVVLIRPHTQ